MNDSPTRPPTLGSRLASPRTLVSLLAAVALIGFFLSRQDPAELDAAWSQLRQASPLLYGAALLAYYLNFPVRALRWRLLLENAGTPAAEIPRNRDLAEIIYLSWFVNALVPAKLGDLYRGWLLRREGGSSWTHAMGTIVAERILDLIVLVGLMVTTGLLTYGDVLAAGVTGGPYACLASPPDLSNLGCSLLQLFAVGGVGALAMIVGLILVARHGSRLEPLMPGRLAAVYNRFSGALVLSFDRFGRLLGLSLLAWSFEGLAFWLVGLALGQSLPLPLVVFFALLQAFITVIPLTPGGLGFEPVLATALEIKGFAGSAALAMTGLYRSISYLSLIAGGALVYLLSKKTK
ncbi:MAG: flippase-like domain-containing protein [Caldilineae bacterium]|nr:flippase-like domain-containing protein [Chloroflexota bacterium]MCB9177194.1 flippase-like domain-containing protein [Caldilineae bacterium]